MYGAYAYHVSGTRFTVNYGYIQRVGTLIMINRAKPTNKKGKKEKEIYVMKKNMNKGFSLVELIIVIAIMAVLVGVLAPQFIKYVESSRQSTDIDNVAEFKACVEAYVADEMAEGDSCPDVTLQWSKAEIKLTGGCTQHTPQQAAVDLGIGGTGLKSDGWSGGTAKYNTSSYKWESITNDVNTKKPCKSMIKAFE